MFQYPIRRLIVRSRKLTKQQDLYLQLLDCSKIFAADVPVKFQNETLI